MLYAFAHATMLWLIIYGIFAERDTATVTGFLFVLFIPLYVASLLISPVLIERDYTFLKDKKYSEHLVIVMRMVLYTASLLFFPAAAILGLLTSNFT